MPSLFDPIQLGAITAPSRILMAPLTRGRATLGHVPTPLMIDYYAQRASAGLIISEATGITQEGSGWPYAPGLWSDEQVTAWRPVLAAVHAAGGRMIAQLWHMGRIVHPSLGGGQPVSSSATTAPGQAHTYDGKQDYVEARALRLDEIPRLIADYVRAARNAMEAGFDGVQIHAANGYLIDQFLRDNSNFRDDAYGGSVDNRIGLLDEVTRAVAGEVGADRTAVRLSPNGDTQGVNDSDPYALFGAAAAALERIGIAFLELREPGKEGTFGRGEVDPVAPTIREHFTGPLVLNSDYGRANGQAMLDAGTADAIAFGRPFIANPDLPSRFAIDASLNPDVMKTWYSQGPEGYTDYSTMERAEDAAAPKRSTAGTAALVVGGALVAGALALLVRDKTTERPPYALVERDGRFEVRDYPAMLVAETWVEDERAAATDQGYLILADYLAARSRSGEPIAMVAPVMSDRERIDHDAMAAPVLSRQQARGWRTRFVMPAAYRLATLPDAPDGVTITEIPARTVAAYRFAETWTDAALAEAERRLRTWVEVRGDIAGRTEFAFYDAPFVPGFLRRNEVLMPL